MASALNNLQRVDMPLNKETKPTIKYFILFISDERFWPDINEPFLLSGHLENFICIQVLIKSQYFTFNNLNRFV